MREMSVAAVLCASSVLCSPASGAAVVLDQVQEDFSGAGAIQAGRKLAQTFTPALTGQLDHVDVIIDLQEGPGYGFTADIVGVNAGVPDGAALASVPVAAPTGGWNTIDFAGQGLHLNAGTQYGLVLTNDDPDAFADPDDWWMVRWDVDVYPAGAFWQWTPTGGWTSEFEFGTADATFRTWMTVIPEPATAGLFALGALAAAWRRRRR